jgi:DNA-binding LytR/AlgR family response regulator
MENPFKKPFAVHETKKEKIVFNLVFGLFIFLFLFLFKPFGLALLESETEFLISLGFGLVTIFMLFLFKFLIEPIVIKRKWTLGNNILWGFIIASSIGVANYFYATLIFPHAFQFKYILLAIWTAILVGAIPATVGYIISFNRMYRSALKDASISPDVVLWDNEVTIRGGNPKNEYKFNPKSIVYLCSNDNYITVVTIKGDIITKTHLRGTLKAAESELKGNSSFFRCHKCFIVNAEYADHVNGHVQNMKIKLKTQGPEIPVSRSKAAEASRKFR